ncbi:hypothetical protein M4D79_21060 [Mycolicibacterium novocastrense]|nr:hypothetical protein M4D79_21060 [Mycolicibacterium novocastrense]
MDPARQGSGGSLITTAEIEPMTTSLSTNGAPIRLGAVLARAGEGVIHEVVDRPDVVAKVFHRDLKDLAAKIAKVGAMIETPPDGIVQSDGFVVLTWPTALLDERDGAVGYLMPRIDTSDAVEIHTLSNPANRANPLPSAPVWTPNVTWSHLVNVAANLCLAVETVHRVDAVIGDFQERNILVNDTTRVTLVDCDSMQFTDASGRQYLCGVARPEFTAPELARVNLAVTAREKPSDLFAFGGAHPSSIDGRQSSVPQRKVDGWRRSTGCVDVGDIRAMGGWATLCIAHSCTGPADHLPALRH